MFDGNDDMRSTLIRYRLISEFGSYGDHDFRVSLAISHSVCITRTHAVYCPSIHEWNLVRFGYDPISYI